MKLWKAVLWAYGLVLLFTVKLPLGSEFAAFIQWGLILAAVIWLIANYDKKLLDSTKSFARGVLVAAVWAVFVQVILGSISGVSLEPAEQAWRSSGGLVGILKDPNVINSILVKQVLILVVIVTSLWIYKNSKQKKWMIAATLIAALVGLMYHANTNFNLFVNSLYNKVSAWALDNAHRNNCDVWLQTELKRGPVGLYVAKKKALYHVNGSKAEVKRILEIGTFLYVEKRQGKKKIVDGIELYKVFIYDDVSGTKEEGYITLIGLSTDPQYAVRMPEPQILTKLMPLKRGEGWITTSLVPKNGSNFYYEILTPNVDFKDVWVRTGNGGEEVNPPVAIVDGKKIGITYLTVDNPLKFQGEIKLSEKCKADSALVRVSLVNM